MNYENSRAMLLAYCKDSYEMENQMSTSLKGNENIHKAQKIASDARASVYKEMGELIYQLLPTDKEDTQI